MSGKREYGLFLPMLLTGFLAAAASRADDVILLDDTAPQPTATSTFTPVPAAKAVPSPTPTAVPAQPQVPTPTHSPVPAKTQAPSPTPAKVEAAVSPEETPAPTDNLSDSARLAQRLGVLNHPVIWFAADGSYSYAFSTADPSISNGFGLDARVEFQFFSWLSAGTYYDLTLFPASGRFIWTGPWGLMARVLPFGADKVKEFNPFLIGGAGLNSLAGQNSPPSGGNLQAFIGVGALYPFGDKWAADLGLTCNFYGNPSNELQTVSARVGAVYFFEP